MNISLDTYETSLDVVLVLTLVFTKRIAQYPVSWFVLLMYKVVSTV